MSGAVRPRSACKRRAVKTAARGARPRNDWLTLSRELQHDNELSQSDLEDLSNFQKRLVVRSQAGPARLFRIRTRGPASHT